MAAGGHGHSLYTTIAAVGSATSITLTAPATVNFSDQYYCIYGKHDDSSAYQSALNACAANGGGSVYFPHGIYLIETNFVLVNQNNAQIIVPQLSNLSLGNLGGSGVIEIYGDHPSRQWGGDPTFGFACPPDATEIVGMQQGNDITSSNAFGSSLLDCRPYNATVSYTTGGNPIFNGHTVYWPANNCMVFTHDLTVITAYSPHLAVWYLLAAVDGSGFRNVNIIGAGAGPAFWTNAPDGTNDYAIIPPGNFNGAYDPATTFMYQGIKTVWKMVCCMPTN